MAFHNSGANAVWANQLGTTPKDVNCNFSWPEFDKPYGVRKLSVSDAWIWSFRRIAKRIKNYSSFNFLPENLERFRSTELYGAALEGSTIFLCHSPLGCTSMESCKLADLKSAIFSSTGCKTKKLPRSKLFLDRQFLFLPQLFGQNGNGKLSITWVEICRVRIWNFTRIGPKTKKLWLSIIQARRPPEQPSLGPPQEGVNCNFSSPQFNKPYGIEKVSISEASLAKR